MKKTAFVLLVISILVLGIAGAAYGFGEGAGQNWGATNAAGTCSSCHGTDFTTSYGPHGNFSDSTDSCRACHDVHDAGSVRKLLPSTTELGVCITCHSFAFTGAGSYGVYGSLRARGFFTQSRHNIEAYNTTELPVANIKSYVATSVIIGGDFSGAPNTTLPVSASGNNNLTCTHCHTPHGNTTLTSFLGERNRAGAGFSPFNSNHILKDNLLGTAHGSYTVYGSYWCAGCHKNRHDSSYTPAVINNHPVVIDPSVAYGAKAQADTGVTWTASVPTGSVGTTHMAGYSRNATSGWAPECQQCHEDYRNVEAAFSVTGPDVDANNPKAQTFPHENESRRMIVESGDDLCLNCHPTSNLP